MLDVFCGEHKNYFPLYFCSSYNSYNFVEINQLKCGDYSVLFSMCADDDKHLN